MALSFGNVREQSLAGDSEFQQLAQEHSSYDAQLQQISRSPYLSAEDILLEAKLKKLKLRAKDLMEKRMAQLARSDSQTH